MKRTLLVSFITLVLCCGAWWAIKMTPGDWGGVDESVVEHFAEQAGFPPRDPYINTDQGDLLLFVFLVAGACGGFVAGYAYRQLFSDTTGSTTP